jgi:raffinose/stachyose/melibiose transport system permease protein
VSIPAFARRQLVAQRRPPAARGLAGRTAVAAGALAWLAVVLVPIYFFALMSLRGRTAYLTQSPWQPTDLTTAGYGEVWRNGFPGYLLNSVVVTGVSSVVIVLLSLLGAYAVVRGDTRFTRMSFRVLLLGLAIPLQAALIPLYLIIVFAGLDDSLGGLILPSIAGGLPVSVLLFVGFLRAVPEELFDAMELDGASELRMLFGLALPLTRQAIVPLVIYNAMQIWDDLLLPLVVIQSDSKATLPLGLFHFQGRYSINVPAVMAAVVLSVIPMIVLYLLVRRHLVGGLTVGAIR